MSADMNNGDGQTLDPSVSIDDDEYVRRRRLKAINDARDRVTDILPHARLEQIQGTLSTEARRALYCEAVQSFLERVRTTIDKLDDGDEVLEEKPIGSWQLATPDGSEYALIDIDGLGTDNIEVQNTHISVHGLNFFYDSDAIFKTYWRVVDRNHLSADDISTKVVRQAIPERISREGFSMAKSTLDDAGINYNPHTEREEYEGKYEYLLDVDGDEL